MFAFFRGTVDYLSESEVWLDVNGVGYEIAISPSTASRLQGFGSEEVTVYTYMMVHEDQIGLYGFLTRDELMLFKKLITVSGVGPKAGLSLLSVLDADDLRFAIASGDVKAISRAPGVGRRTAERLILELKDKINAAAPAAAQEAGEEPGITGGEQSGDAADAVAALVALGYGRAEAVKAVHAAKGEGISGTEELLKGALRHMS
ncbi:MAG: Holliday junction branch migration protein RuvA [Lachnospiraceae bacterium]|jgi:Holliday junction DNA helicase RuvA|nr:Holliday junction branch migration protein RuvA [Lachnospiraceae bacterium]MCH4027538.1 Holliday junction branch migration protein RuvA [Lachnospiraceae bacterium]MCH4065378.1 Holliday junction branch migration protein RuvA [Lachnospiraceae bacterium]MCH4111418.1 Holliday junction branch migration protein RuvA [Lachnospiraceae bacterium]MCI1353014.1 Holliday junction branch migration protein RuvA [Lachnospiraceae bacterium]